MRQGKAADAHGAGVVGLECVKARQLMPHDAGVVRLECVRARQLMLMMLGLLGWNASGQGS